MRDRVDILKGIGYKDKEARKPLKGKGLSYTRTCITEAKRKSEDK